MEIRRHGEYSWGQERSVPEKGTLNGESLQEE
jgi:hypothetical protein